MFKYGLNLKKKGKNWFAKCPFHKNSVFFAGASDGTERTASFAINEKKGFYHCFGCGINGRISGLNAELKAINKQKRAAMLSSLGN